MKKFIQLILIAIILATLSVSTVGATEHHAETLTVNQLTLSPQQARPDAPVTLTWDTNADYVAIEWTGFRNGYRSACSGYQGENVPSERETLRSYCPPSGSAIVPDGTKFTFGASLDMDTDNKQHFSESFLIECDPAAWFFETHIKSCPTEMPRQVDIHHQRFEHGVMLQTMYEPNIVNVLFGHPSGSNTSHYLRYDLSNLPATPAVAYGQPPSNRYIPSGAFEKVWLQRDVMDQLGFAVEAQPSTYKGYHQELVFEGGVWHYISSPTPNRIFHISSAWFDIDWSYQSVSVPTSDGDCVIPASGPWPECARNGNPTQSNTSTSNNGDCVIPERGPWPQCATAGNNPPPNTADCIIPAYGPWPACARS